MNIEQRDEIGVAVQSLSVIPWSWVQISLTPTFDSSL